MSCAIKKILISQPAPTSKNSPYYALAEKFGLTLEFKQFIKVVTLEPVEFRKQRISVLDYTAVIFTSRTAVDHFFALSQELRITIPETMKYFCSNETVALYLQKYIVYRKRKVFFSSTGKIDGLLPTIVKNNKEKFLVPVAEEHTDDLFQMLTSKKINFTEAVMYRTVSRDLDIETLDHDAIVFFSPMGIQSLFHNFPSFEQNDILILASGPQTAKAVEEAGLRLDYTLSIPGQTLSVIGSLEQFLEQKTNS